MVMVVCVIAGEFSKIFTKKVAGKCIYFNWITKINGSTARQKRLPDSV
ncbi:hypothetical protein EC990670_3983 [Escherichia coli 99.0670]|nr:hypothetical protein EC990670_3983 [Escherichia coli 99.0670]